MNTSSRLLARARSWEIVDEPLASLDELLRRSGMGVNAPALNRDREPGELVRGDAALGRLVRVAADDELAGRVVLQRLLPGISGIARRRGSFMVEHLAAVDDLLPSAWSVIRSYPIDRRAHHVAANLLRDCEYDAFRRFERRTLVHDYVGSGWFDRAVEEHERCQEPMIELLEVVRLARNRSGFDAATLERDVALLTMLLTGATLNELAEQLHVSERTVRSRRDAMLHRLRAAAAVAA